MVRLAIPIRDGLYGTNLANLGTPVHTLKSLMGHLPIKRKGGPFDWTSHTGNAEDEAEFGGTS